MRTPSPAFVTAILNWRWTSLVARLALVSAYLLGAVVKLGDWPGAVAEQAHFGLHPPALWAGITIAVELVGAVLILSGRCVWLGAGMLGIFTLLAAITANAFWGMPAGPDRFMATNAFFEHLGLIAGFVLVARPAPLPGA
ncbi:DoxX family protein [Sphingomonas sp. RB3P16]|uniref:DoxX family protein n=1 Tax=Parasphingomonas frigoris TaxID=3096163 RepID=UPI002FCB4886